MFFPIFLFPILLFTDAIDGGIIQPGSTIGHENGPEEGGNGTAKMVNVQPVEMEMVNGTDGKHGNVLDDSSGGNGTKVNVPAEMVNVTEKHANVLDELNSSVMAILSDENAFGNGRDKRHTKIDAETRQRQKIQDEKIMANFFAVTKWEDLLKEPAEKNSTNNRLKREIGEGDQNAGLQELLEHKLLFGKCISLWEHNFAVVAGAINAKKDGTFDLFCPKSQIVWYYGKINEIRQLAKEANKICRVSLLPLLEAVEAAETNQFLDAIKLVFAEFESGYGRIEAQVEVVFGAFNEEFEDFCKEYDLPMPFGIGEDEE